MLTIALLVVGTFILLAPEMRGMRRFLARQLCWLADFVEPLG